jgi:DNA-binding HxlR family transcriptional regulator
LETENQESLEEAVFKTLSNQKRRDILRVVGERKEATFTEIKDAAEIEDSPSLSYHLNALNRLIVQKSGKYSLSELGQDAYNLICKTAAFSASNSTMGFLRRGLPAVIVANAILWAAAIFAVSQFEGSMHQLTLFSFAALWFISNIILYTLHAKTKSRSC